MDSAQVVRKFEEEFKNRSNFDVVDALMSGDFVHHLPYPDLPPGRAGMKAVGQLITGVVRDIQVSIPLMFTDGDLVADRVEAQGTRVDNGASISWAENHIYRIAAGRIAELWPAGGPQL